MLFAAAILLAALALPGILAAQTGVSGTVHYRDGRSVDFERIGLLKDDEPRETIIAGKIGDQTVRYKLHDFSEIIFTGNHRYSKNHRGPMIVTNPEGERYTLEDAYVEVWFSSLRSRNDHSGRFLFAYNDPITKKLTQGSDTFGDDISSITLGEHRGELKQNPSTEEFFPAAFNFDPFTGERLVWQSRE